MSSKFDRYMIRIGAAKHIKFRRLNTAERHAFFLGVLSIAAQSPVRGCLMIGYLAAEAADVAAEADVPEKVAASAMRKLRDVGVLEADGNGFEWVHDFEEHNPPPKRDDTATERQQRKRDRDRASRRDVTAVTHRDSATGSVIVTDRHAGEGEVEEEGEEKTAASPLRARAGEPGQSLAGSVACPQCNAPAGELCRAARGGTRQSFHLRRHHAVSELTHITARRAPRTVSSVPSRWAPSAEALALIAEHFPDEQASAVESCIATLGFRREPVTPEAVRALLVGDEAA